MVATSYWKVGVRPSLPFDYYQSPQDSAPATLENITKVGAENWVPMTGDNYLHTGWRSQTVWLRVTIPASPNAVRFTGGINKLLIHDVDMFLATPGSAPPRLLASGSDPKSWASPNEPSFSVLQSPLHQQIIYLKIRSRTFWSMPFFVQTDQVYQARMAERSVAFGILYGCMLSILGVSITFYFILHQPFYAVLALFKFVFLILLAFYNGDCFRFAPHLANETHINVLLFNSIFLALIYFAVLSHLFIQYDNNISSQSRISVLRMSTITACMIFALFCVPDPMLDLAVPFSFLIYVGQISHRLIRNWNHLRTRLNGFSASVTNAGVVCAILVLLGLISHSVYTEIAYGFGAVLMSAFFMADVARSMRGIQNDRQIIIEKLKKSSPTFIGSSAENSPGEIRVSILFIDIVGFSTLAETEDPEVIFSLLSRQMLSMTKTIEKYGGKVDRSLGDGLLCFFAGSDPDHVEQGFLAANEIQKKIASDVMSLATKKSQDKILSVRIGMHTDKVLIGNLGGSSRIDFTMIGQGVNFANRLEQACAPMKIMISSETREQLLNHGFNADDFVAIKIPIKHQANLVQAYECDPFKRQPELLSAVNIAQRKQVGTRHRNPRHVLTGDHQIKLSGSDGVFTVADFSETGFRVKSRVFLAQNAVIELNMDTGDAYLNKCLEDKLLTRLTIEVKWSRSSSQGCEHGFKILGETPAQSSYRLSILLSHPASPVSAEISA
jgi:class 3 adenylate cyclase